MKDIIRSFLIICCLLFGLSASAQGTFSITGIVTDDKGVTQPGASVFISGTKLMTATDGDGKFAFGKLTPGTYQLSVKMLGFDAYAKPVIIKNASVQIDVVLKVKATDLKEVVINPTARNKDLEFFKGAFLGSAACKILNPDVLSFTHDNVNKLFSAEASDLIIIENSRLGYRIKYLLKYFSFDKKDGMTTYDGETSFEELPGTEKQKEEWAKNRADTYRYSMMHLMRAIYAGDLKKEGFWVRNVLSVKNRSYSDPLNIEAEPGSINLKDYVTTVDTAFVSLRFNKLYIVRFNNEKEMTPKMDRNAKNGKFSIMTDNGTLIELIAKDVLIDRRGSYAVYKTFVVEGYMGAKRVGDQLPFEYWP